MRYIIEVYCFNNKIYTPYYFYPSDYGNIMTDDPWKAMSYGFHSIEGAKNFFNNSQESFKNLFSEQKILGIKIISVKCSIEDVCSFM